MRKILTAATAAITGLALLAASATTAVAEPHGGWHGGGGGWHGGEGGWRGGDHDWHGGRGVGWGIGAGLAGFALGAALASPHYGYGYGYGPAYGYGPYYDDDYYGAQCVGTRRVWDPYYGGYVIRRFYYAC
jgi:hypothetical protein